MSPVLCVPLSLVCALVQPTEFNTYADIEAAFRCLETKYGIREEDVILYGQSVGSGPTVDLGARTPRLRGVVLHSPIMSGVRVLYEVKHTYWFDIFPVSIPQTHAHSLPSFRPARGAGSGHVEAPPCRLLLAHSRLA